MIRLVIYLDKVPVGQRKKVMGHRSETVKQTTSSYESGYMLVDKGNIFRKERPRPEKTEVLSRHLKTKRIKYMTWGRVFFNLRRGFIPSSAFGQWCV
jgi:hypothetical protein